MNKFNTMPFAAMGNRHGADEEEDIDLEDALLQEALEEERVVLPPDENDDYSQKVKAFVAGQSIAEETSPDDGNDALKEIPSFTDDDKDGIINYDISHFQFDQKEITSFLQRIGASPLEHDTRDQIRDHLKKIVRLLGTSYRVTRERELLSLYTDLVPPDGPAETVAGEIVRATAEVQFIVNEENPDAADSLAALYLADNAGQAVRDVIEDMRNTDPAMHSVISLPLLYKAVIEYIRDNPWLREVSNKTDFGQMDETEEAQTEQEDRSND